MYEKCLFFNLNSFTRLLNKRWEDEFAHFGLSPSHGYLLRLVLAKPGTTQKLLADEMELAPSTVTRFLEALETKGFVKRSCCTQDGRATTVDATKKAVAIAKELDRASQRLTQFLTDQIGDRETADLVERLRRNSKKIVNARLTDAKSTETNETKSSK